MTDQTGAQTGAQIGQDPTGPITETPEGVTFADLGLSPNLLSAITEAGYTTPTPIQYKAIPEVLAGRDVLGIAQTGTGKTAAFVLPMIEKLAGGRARARMPRTLILEPTRELADQVAENFRKYGKNNKLNMALLIGGVSFGDQEALLTKGVDVLIATPGRLLDHFERGKLLLTGVQMLVIDEADRMLDMGFIPDIERIVKLTPFTRQTLFFSATMPPEIQRLTEQFLSAPAKVEVARQSQAAATITQRLVKCVSSDPKTKRACLRATIEAAMATMKNGIIFCNRKTDVDIVAKSLSKYGFDAAPIHGDLQQSQRTATLEKFRNGDLKILVASDVAARGLDIPDVSHVFNFDVPRHAEDYVHRIGRTGRAGRSGEAFMLVTNGDVKSLDAVQKLIKTNIEYADIPGLPSDRVQDERAARPSSSAHQSERADRPARGPRRRGPRADAETGPVAAPVDPLPVMDVMQIEDHAAADGFDIPDAPALPIVTERNQGGRRDSTPRREREPRRERQERPERGQRRDRQEEREPVVVAFGDDIPAFMRRPVFAKT
jgi:superfamily II DNA/RNA helicase